MGKSVLVRVNNAVVKLTAAISDTADGGKEDEED